MSPEAAHILRDILFLVLAVLAIGLPLHAWVRRRDPASQWHRHGNVWTGPFHFGDLAACLALIVTLALLIRPREIEANDATAIGPADVLVGTAFFVAIVILICAAIRMRRHSIAETFGLARMGSGTILLHSVLWTVFAVVVALGSADWWTRLLESRALTTGEQEMVALLRDSNDFALRLAIAFAAVLIQPVAEEVIFRGYLHAAIKRYSDALLASICSAAVFGVLHMSLEAFLPLFLLGLILSWAYEQTGSLWIPITIHALFNATTVVYQTTFAAP